MSNSKKQITVLATSAIDVLEDERLNQISSQPGGPSYFIAQVFNANNLSYEKLMHPQIKVEIQVTPRGEFSKIAERAKTLNIDYSNITTPYLLISTVLEDFSLDGIKDYKGKAFLDVQGYVRDGSDFGKKRSWTPNAMDAFFCIKGTEEEISYLPKDLIEIQKTKLLIITKAENGVDWYYKGTFKSIRPLKIITNLKDTIGAGDYFFANFIVNFIESSLIEQSIMNAISKTSTFLESKRIKLNINN